MINALCNVYYAVLRKWVNFWARRDRAVALSRRPCGWTACYVCDGSGLEEDWGEVSGELNHVTCSRCGGFGLE